MNKPLTGIVALSALIAFTQGLSLMAPTEHYVKQPPTPTSTEAAHLPLLLAAHSDNLPAAAPLTSLTLPQSGELENTTDDAKPARNAATEKSDLAAIPATTPIENADIFSVPFFSQFKNITAPEWRKVGCGVASLAMLIEFYEPGQTTVDTLLADGIDADAYLNDAGWTHAGLIGLSRDYGLDGASHSLSALSMADAFAELSDVVSEGPVMVSVHYTFEPTNPIPHLVVINGVKDGLVYYNDPAEATGGGSISIAKFQKAWKKRYIEIRPA